MTLLGVGLSAAERPGDFAVRKDAATGALMCTCADPVVCVSFEFLDSADPHYVTYDGDLVTFTLDNGTWVYRIVGRNDIDRWYLARRVD